MAEVIRWDVVLSTALVIIISLGAEFRLLLQCSFTLFKFADV